MFVAWLRFWVQSPALWRKTHKKAKTGAAMDGWLRKTHIKGIGSGDRTQLVENEPSMCEALGSSTWEAKARLGV